MNKIYNYVRWARSAAQVRDMAYDKLTTLIDEAAARPAQTPTDRFIKLTKVAGLEGFRRYQFSHVHSLGYTTALTLDAAIIAFRASRGASLLPFGTPFLLGSLALYALVGTGEKTSWEAPRMHPALFAAAAVTRFGVLGLGEIVASKTGRRLEKKGFGTLAKAAFAIATCFSYGIEPLRVALACISFVAQIPFALVGALVSVGIAYIAAARHDGLKGSKDGNPHLPNVEPGPAKSEASTEPLPA